MAVQATGLQQRQQMPWNPQKQDVDEDNVVAVDEDEDDKLAKPLHHTVGHHLSDESPHSNMTYLTIKRHNKHKNIEITSKRSRYISDEHTRSTQPNSSAL